MTTIATKPKSSYSGPIISARGLQIGNATGTTAVNPPYATRWFWTTDGVAESGANAGSNLVLKAIADDGTTVVATCITVNRATGVVTFNQGTTPVTSRIPLTLLRNGDLTVMNATGSSTTLKLQGTIGTALGAATAAVQNTTNTCAAVFEYVIPNTYVAGSNLTLTANMMRVVASGATMTTSVDFSAYKIAGVGTAGTDIVTTNATAFTSTTGVDCPFTITGTGLNVGDCLEIKMTVVATEGGDAGTVQSVVNSLKMAA